MRDSDGPACADYKRSSMPIKGGSCNVCRRLIGKGKPCRVAVEEVSWFRGDDVMHWRCEECHQKQKREDK